MNAEQLEAADGFGVAARRVLGIVALAAGLAMLGWITHLATAERVARVQVAGAFSYLDRNDVRDVIGAQLDRPMLGVDVAGIREAAMALPWVREVSVRRDWPDTLVVNIAERKPLAMWNADRVLDTDGVVFEPGYSNHALPRGLRGMPRLYGPNGREAEVLSRLEALNELLARVGLPPAGELRTNTRGAWTARLEDGMRLRLGKIDGGAPLPQAQLDVLGRLIAGTGARVASADLRYRNGFALRFISRPPDGVVAALPQASSGAAL